MSVHVQPRWRLVILRLRICKLSTNGWAAGFMSNRGRQNVASYLVLDCGVDWRQGADYFESVLTDYDVCSNWGNWLAAAGLSVRTALLNALAPVIACDGLLLVNSLH